MKLDHATQCSSQPSPPRGGVLPAPIAHKDDPVLTREFIFNTVAVVFDVDTELLLKPNRGRAEVAMARQVAMYLAHVGCELSLTAVGRVFGRDRSTVAHACKRIEDARERPQFDRAIAMMERSVGMIVKTSPALRRDLAIVEEGVWR